MEKGEQQAWAGSYQVSGFIELSADIFNQTCFQLLRELGSDAKSIAAGGFDEGEEEAAEEDAEGGGHEDVAEVDVSLF
jgi:hypothetical protein